MNSVACMAVLSWMLLASSVTSVFGAGPSARVLDLAATLSGQFSDGGQVDADIAGKTKIVHDKLELEVVPAEIAFLSPGVASYVLEKVNGKLTRKEIHVAKENDEGAIVVERYNFTNRDQFGLTVPAAADLAALKPEDLVGPRKDCVSEYVKEADNLYSANVPDCVNFNNDGSPVAYAFIVTCSFFSTAPPVKSSPEKADTVPYKMIKLKSYPLPDSVTKDAAGWTSPCGKA